MSPEKAKYFLRAISNLEQIDKDMKNYAAYIAFEQFSFDLPRLAPLETLALQHLKKDAMNKKRKSEYMANAKCSRFLSQVFRHFAKAECKLIELDLSHNELSSDLARDLSYLL